MLVIRHRSSPTNPRGFQRNITGGSFYLFLLLFFVVVFDLFSKACFVCFATLIKVMSEVFTYILC